MMYSNFWHTLYCMQVTPTCFERHVAIFRSIHKCTECSSNGYTPLLSYTELTTHIEEKMLGWAGGGGGGGGEEKTSAFTNFLLSFTS